MTLITKENTLDAVVFKERLAEFKWLRVPRNLTQDHQDHFYIVNYEDEDYKIRISIRPSKLMSVSESYKHCNLKGDRVSKEYKGEKFTFGRNVEVQLGTNILTKIEDLSVDFKKEQIQKVEL